MQQPRVDDRSAARAHGTLAVVLALSLGACGGDGSNDEPGGNDGATSGSASGVAGGGPDTDAVLTGELRRYGVVNVADEAGEASDALAAFYRVDPSIDLAELGTLSGSGPADCRVTPAAEAGNALASVGYLPSPAAARATSIGAGETVSLIAPSGSWAELAPTAIGAFDFYDPDNALPAGAVPSGLGVSVSGAAETDGFPAFTDAVMPAVAPLEGFIASDEGPIDAATSFRWTAGSDGDARVLIASSTSFFSDAPNALRVECLVPDNGAFAFPAGVRAALGADFMGDAPSASRLAIVAERQGDSVLLLVRESFAR